MHCSRGWASWNLQHIFLWTSSDYMTQALQFFFIFQENPEDGGWHDLVAKGFIEYIDTEEEETTMISMTINVSTLWKMNHDVLLDKKKKRLIICKVEGIYKFNCKTCTRILYKQGSILRRHILTLTLIVKFTRLWFWVFVLQLYHFLIIIRYIFYTGEVLCYSSLLLCLLFCLVVLIERLYLLLLLAVST